MLSWTMALLLLAVLFLFAVLGAALYSPSADWLVRALHVKSDLPHADVIVVLSGGTYRNGELSSLTLERVVRGIQLWRMGLANKLLFSGGCASDCSHVTSDAECMKAFAIEFGVPEQETLVETTSSNTYENIRYVANLMMENRLRRALLVTSAFHLRRAIGVARKTGIEFLPVPSSEYDGPRAHPLERLVLLFFSVRELVALVVYRVRGWV